ncbi:hypothetical protein HDU76_008269 [Blyttiomyces sp. JEL0837]|nr:hypothetical protein HDU76_008269 [Blyttiomyces sp. JEL0837]
MSLKNFEEEDDVNEHLKALEEKISNLANTTNQQALMMAVTQALKAYEGSTQGNISHGHDGPSVGNAASSMGSAAMAAFAGVKAKSAALGAGKKFAGLGAGVGVTVNGVVGIKASGLFCIHRGGNTYLVQSVFVDQA